MVGRQVRITQPATQKKAQYSGNTSPMCPKQPAKKSTFILKLSAAHARLGALLLILALATLSGGLWLNSQAEKNNEVLTEPAAEVPEPLFLLNLVTSRTNSYVYSANKHLLENLPKIGIEIFPGRVYPGVFPVTNMVTDSIGRLDQVSFGFSGDLVVKRWPHDPFGKWSFSNYYHSPETGYSGYPINLTNLDITLEKMNTASTPSERRNLLCQALGLILWDTHVVTAIGDVFDAFGVKNDLQNFDADRWSYGHPNLPELYYATSGRTTFAFSSPNSIRYLNPALAFAYDALWFPRAPLGSLYSAAYVSKPVFSRLFEYDANLTLKPLLAADFPVAISSADLIPLTGISEDSPFYGKEGTAWGANPTINASQHNPNVSASDHSMFLVRLRDGIPWQPGYGYTAEMKLNVTADDLVWTLSYFLNDALRANWLEPPPGQVMRKQWYGADYRKAIEKINDSTVKINLCGPTGDGHVTEWLEALAISPLPRHILDPSTNTTGGVGYTPDGTRIHSYNSQFEYRYNTGEGDTPLVACGPYYLESVTVDTLDPSNDPRYTLRKFEDWGGRGAASLWNEDPYKRNNIDTYTHSRYQHMERAVDALQGDFGSSFQAIFQLDGIELANLDYTTRHTDPAFDSVLSTLRDSEGLKIEYASTPSQLVLAFDIRDTHLSQQLVRLAISHAIPREAIMAGVDSENAVANEILGLPHTSMDYPQETEWDTIGPANPINTINGSFSGHITYDLEKAWALMELAGYNMTAFRQAYSDASGKETQTDGIVLFLWPPMIAIVVLGRIRLTRRSDSD